MHETDEIKKNPESKYDALIYKQNCVNDTVTAQVKKAFLLRNNLHVISIFH